MAAVPPASSPVSSGFSLWPSIKRRFLNTMLAAEPSISSALPGAITAPKVAHPSLKKIDSVAYDTVRSVLLFTLGTVAQVTVQGINSVTVYNKDKFSDLVLAVRSGQIDRGLLTVVNHHSVYDEPCIIGNVVPYSWLIDSNVIRWSLCAKDTCFSNKALGAFFSLNKALPVIRGGGVDQKPLQVAIDKLNNREWINIFPEGKVVREGKIGSVRPGVGRLVCAAERPPLVVPIYHTGMHNVKPYDDFLPSKGKRVRVIVGQPIYFDELIAKFRAEGRPETELYRAIATTIETEFYRLKLEVEEKDQEGELWTERFNRFKKRAGFIWFKKDEGATAEGAAVVESGGMTSTLASSLSTAAAIPEQVVEYFEKIKDYVHIGSWVRHDINKTADTPSGASVHQSAPKVDNTVKPMEKAE